MTTETHGAAVPFMITQKNRSILRGLGHTDSEIDAMKPGDALGIIRSNAECVLESGTGNKLLDAALSYAGLGWHVFPCHNPIKKAGWSCSCELWKREKVNPEFECHRPGKHPRTENGLDDATTDPDQIRAWWKKWPAATIGINCGLSGLLVVDLDSYKDTYQGDSLDLDEETVTGLSGGGGGHLFYAMADGDTFGSSNKNLPSGVDIKGHGGYVIVAPSSHKSGNAYQWENDYSPFDRAPAPIPAKLRALLENRVTKHKTEQPVDTAIKYGSGNATAYGSAAIQAQCESVRSSTNGTRNNTLNAAAYSIGRLVAGGEIDVIFAKGELGAAAADVGLSDDEATGTIDSGMGAGMKDPKTAPNNGFEATTPTGLGDAIIDDQQPSSGEQVAFVAELLRLTIDAGQDIDTLRDAVKKLTEQDKRDPLIIEQLRRAIPCGKKTSQETEIERWLRSCGNDRAGETETIIIQLNRHGYTFRMNELDDSIETSGQILSDGLQAEIRCLMRDMKFKYMDAVKDAYTMNAYHNRYHPIKDFLDALAWDGRDHIAELAGHFSCSDSPIAYRDGATTTVIHAFLKRWLVGAVGKVYEQAQNVTLTMAGPQGIGKSYVAKWLCSPMKDFFNEGQLEPDGKETDRRLATTWIWEIGELGATTRRSDVNALKNKLTQGSVKFRVPYGHSDVIKPVLTSFIGTVNPDGRGFLIDRTGNRRFAVVNITSINHGYSSTMDAAQVWAQAMSLYRAGEPWQLLPEERSTQEAINTEHTAEDTLDMIMRSTFAIDGDNDNWRLAPFDVAHALFMRNYAKDVDKCAKDASAWLKANGHIKRGKPLTWRGIKEKSKDDIEREEREGKKEEDEAKARSLGL